MSGIYTASQFINFVETVFDRGKIDGRKENIQVLCPFCVRYKRRGYSNKKLAIKLNNPHITHCWVCGYKSKNLFDLLRKFHNEYIDEYKNKFLNAEDISQIRNEEKNLEHVVSLPNGFDFLINFSKEDGYANAAKKYLRSRGINKTRDLWYWKIGITKNFEGGCGNRIIVPSFDKDGKLNYWTARSWSDKKSYIYKDKKYQIYKYKNPFIENRTEIIFNELNIDWCRELTLVEGVFDLFKCNENATAVLGSDLDINYKLFQQIIAYQTPVLLAFDNEPSAQYKQMKLAKALSAFDIKIRMIELPNKNLDVGDLTKTQFISLSNNAKLFSEDYFLRRKIASIV